MIRGGIIVAKSGADERGIGFQDTLWAAADKLRGTVDAAECKHVVLGRDSAVRQEDVSS